MSNILICCNRVSFFTMGEHVALFRNIKFLQVLSHCTWKCACWGRWVTNLLHGGGVQLHDRGMSQLCKHSSQSFLGEHFRRAEKLLDTAAVKHLAYNVSHHCMHARVYTSGWRGEWVWVSLTPVRCAMSPAAIYPCWSCCQWLKYQLANCYLTLVFQATPFAERRRAWSRCSWWIVTEERTYQTGRLDNKMLTSTKHVIATPWQSTKSTDLIGHSKFLLWRQLNGCSMTRPFLSLQRVWLARLGWPSYIHKSSQMVAFIHIQSLLRELTWLLMDHR